MPGTNLPKKPLNQFGQKQFWQVCASATSRNARAAAKKEACRFVDGKTQSFCAPAQRAITALPKSGSLEPKRFKRAFGDFSLTGKVTRPEGRNTSLSLLRGQSHWRRSAKYPVARSAKSQLWNPQIKKYDRLLRVDRIWWGKVDSNHRSH